MSNFCKPNFLFIMVDEMRYPPVYENKELIKWQLEKLKAQQKLKKHGMEFKRHYAGSTACSPSRATLFTGQYPSLHGVSQTSGLAKSAFDPDMFWLDANTVPTMGRYFRTAGYRTFYKGKWHVSEEDIIIPGTKNSLTSYQPITGKPNMDAKLYFDANRLDKYGFDGWVGPEPHGGNPYNSGASAPTGVGGRDIVYADEVVSLIKNLASDPNDTPWLLVASFVNPHDIALHGDYTNSMPIYDFDVDPSVPDIPPPPTYNENLDTKPIAQQSYKKVYPQALQPVKLTAEKHRRLYYTLEKKVDDMIDMVLDAIMTTDMYKNTIIIFTSDHGDQLGAHGLYQKWYNMYEESIHIPLIFHNPILFPEQTSTDILTSHVDIIPTMLGLAGINVNNLDKKLKSIYADVKPLVGKKICFNKNVSKKLEYHCDANDSPIYFNTFDNPTSGPNQYNQITGKHYKSVVQPNAIQAVIAYLDTNDPNVKYLYKYAKYYDPESSETQYEMYNVTLDPLETKNLANPSNFFWRFVHPTLRTIFVPLFLFCC